jgi:hypothetical protein
MALFANARWRPAVPASLALIGIAAGLREAMDSLLMPKGLARYAFGIKPLRAASRARSGPVRDADTLNPTGAEQPALGYRVARRGHLGQLAGNADRV